MGWVRQPDEGGLDRRRMLVEDLLDLAGVEVEAAPDDQVLLAVHDVEEAAFVLVGHAPGMQPAVLGGLRGRLRPVPLALHDVVTPDDDLTHLAGREVVTLLVATRIWTPSTGRPMDPARLFPVWLNEATGEVLVSPYPSRIWAPNVALNPLRTSTGRAAPPEMLTRSVEVFAVSAPALTRPGPSSGALEHGHPGRSMTFRAVTGSNRGTIVMLAPARTAVFRPQVCPNEWWSGRQPITTSSGPSASSGAMAAQLAAMSSWVSFAPFGVSVVPGV